MEECKERGSNKMKKSRVKLTMFSLSLMVVCSLITIIFPTESSCPQAKYFSFVAVVFGVIGLCAYAKQLKE